MPRLRTLLPALAGTGALAVAGAGAGALAARRAGRTSTPRPVLAGRSVPRVLFVGGGYVGLYGALGLRRRLAREDVEIAVLDPRPYMTYLPFLPEAAAGSLEPRHVVTSLHRELRGCSIITGSLAGLRHAERTAVVRPLNDDPDYELTYDHVVLGLGSVARTLPIPGLAEHAMGFKHIEEAIELRNRVLGLMDVAASTWDAQERRRMLTFVFVGGGFAGVEALGEVEDMARAATKLYDSIRPEDLRFVLVEGAGRILPELGEELGGYAVEQLRARGVEIHLNTFLSSCTDGHVVLSTGQEFDAETVVWTAGVKAHPALADTDLPLDERGRVTTDATFRVTGPDGLVDGAWAAGDNAAVPDLTGEPGATCAPTAQHAVRQGRLLGANLARVLSGGEPQEYRHENLGTVASLGLGKGVADILGVKMRGPVAWFMHRSYHMLAMPTLERRVRVVTDWTTALFFRRELTSLGSLQSPRAEFLAVATPAPEEQDQRED